MVLATAIAEEGADNPRPAAGPAKAEPDKDAEGKETEEPFELNAERLAELLDALDSKEASRRSAAAKTLGEAKAKAAIHKLVKMLDDPDDDPQWQATVALGAIGTPALPRLIDALNLERERARWKAENAIKMIGAEAVPALIKALKDKRVRVRQSAAYLLGELADPRSMGPLAAAMADKDEDTRWKAATSLTKFGRRATAVVLKQLSGGPIEGRRCAAWVFQQTRDSTAVAALVHALRDRDDQVRWKTAIALQKIGQSAAAPLLSILRSTAKKDQKNIATWILEGIKDVKVQTALQDLKGALSLGGKQTTARPRPKVLPKSVVVAVNSTPPKATVFIDDKYAGVTPLTVKSLTPGHHFLKLTKRDHLPWTKLVELLYAKETIDAKLTLKPKGTIIVTSEPAQADVYVDGEYEGKTPLEMKNLDANPYSVRVEKEHFLPWESEVEIRAGKEVRVHGKLKSKVEGWYLARLKKNPNDVSCHTELAHYYMVRGQLDRSARAIAVAVEVIGNGADTSGYAGRLAQEIAKMWTQAFQFGGDLKLPAVRKALHGAIHGVWTRNRKKAPLRRFLAQLRKSVSADFTNPAK